MDAHADFHFVLRQGEIGFTHRRDNAGPERHAQTANVGNRLLGSRLDLRKRGPLGGLGPGSFIGKE